jgi:hypothetical protein
MELVIGTLIKKQVNNIVSVLPKRNKAQDDILVEMQVAECMFNMASTSNEIEASIYRLQSAELKYKAFILLEKDTFKNYQ